MNKIIELNLLFEQLIYKNKYKTIIPTIIVKNKNKLEKENIETSKKTNETTNKTTIINTILTKIT